MSKIGMIISNYRTQMESAGLLRRPEAMQLSPKVAAMPTSFTKARLALQEYSRASVKVQDSPMTILFEYTLPKLEPLLIELGEERAEQLVIQLCEYGKKVIGESPDKAPDHLKDLFTDLPNYYVKIKEENGLAEIINAHRLLYLEKRGEEYLKLKLGDKIKNIQIDRDGMILMVMSSEMKLEDLVYLKKVTNLKSLYFRLTKVTDIWLKHLIDITTLQQLGFGGDQVTDAGLVHLKGLTNLQELNLWATKVTDSGIEELKKAIPGLNIKL